MNGGGGGKPPAESRAVARQGIPGGNAVTGTQSYSIPRKLTSIYTLNVT